MRSEPQLLRRRAEMAWSWTRCLVLPQEFRRLFVGGSPQWRGRVVQEFRHAGLGLIWGCPLRQGERGTHCACSWVFFSRVLLTIMHWLFLPNLRSRGLGFQQIDSVVYFLGSRCGSWLSRVVIKNINILAFFSSFMKCNERRILILVCLIFDLDWSFQLFSSPITILVSTSKRSLFSLFSPPRIVIYVSFFSVVSCSWSSFLY